MAFDARQTALQSPWPRRAPRKRRGFYNLPMSVFALGLNHTTAPLDLRGRFAFTPEQLVPTLHAFRERMERVSECSHRRFGAAAEHGGGARRR